MNFKLNDVLSEPVQAEDLLDANPVLQVAFQELTGGEVASGPAESSVRCSDGACCVENGLLFLLGEELRSWPLPQGQVVKELAVLEKIAAMLADGQLVIWQDKEGQLLQEATLWLPECPSILWCPEGHHLLCFGRQVESFFLVSVSESLRRLSLELTPNDAMASPGFVAAASFRPHGGFLAASTESCLSLWRWATPPCVSLAETRPSEEALKLSFGSDLLLALFPSELRVYSCALEPCARVLRLQVADVAAGAVALAQRSRLAWLREGSQVVAELAEPVQQLRLAPGQRLKALAQVNGRWGLLSVQPVLTRSLALCLRQSCLKAWERSMAQLPRAVKRRTKRSEEAPVELLGELAELNLHRNTMSSRLEEEACLVMPFVAEKLGELLASEEGQLFHERFLAIFPEQELQKELTEELKDTSQHLKELLEGQLKEALRRCLGPAVRKELPLVLLEAVEAAVLGSATSIASTSAKQAVQRLHAARPSGEELSRAALELLSKVEVPEALGLELGAWREKRLRGHVASLEESLERLREEVALARESLKISEEPLESSDEGETLCNL